MAVSRQICEDQEAAAEATATAVAAVGDCYRHYAVIQEAQEVQGFVHDPSMAHEAREVVVAVDLQQLHQVEAAVVLVAVDGGVLLAEVEIDQHQGEVLHQDHQPAVVEPREGEAAVAAAVAREAGQAAAVFAADPKWHWEVPVDDKFGD